MTYPRIIGWYLTLTVLLLLILSMSQIKAHNPVDLSFLIVLPFAFGLIFFKKWALWGTGILGICFILIILTVTITHSISNFEGLTVGLGPFILTQPKSTQLWLYAISTTVLIGLPMSSILIPLLWPEKK